MIFKLGYSHKTGLEQLSVGPVVGQENVLGCLIFEAN